MDETFCRKVRAYGNRSFAIKLILIVSFLIQSNPNLGSAAWRPLATLAGRVQLKAVEKPSVGSRLC